MVLPILIRISEEAFRSVPQEYRLGAAALGMSRTASLASILLPAAAPAIGAGIVLGVGRALAETAALLFTAGYDTRLPQSLLHSGRVLSVHIHELAMNIPGGDRRAYATALILMALLLVMNTVATQLARFAVRQTR